MIVLGVVLLVVGGLLAYFGRPREKLILWAGVAIFAAGLLLLVIGLLDRADAHAAAFGVLMLGMVTAGGGELHGAGDGEKAVPVSGGSTVQTRPVLFAFVVSAVPVVAAFVLVVLDATTVSIPTWIPVLLTGMGPLLGALSALWAQSKVTPLVAPRTDGGEPLVPVSAHLESGG